MQERDIKSTSELENYTYQIEHLIEHRLLQCNRYDLLNKKRQNGKDIEKILLQNEQLSVVLEPSLSEKLIMSKIENLQEIGSKKYDKYKSKYTEYKQHYLNTLHSIADFNETFYFECNKQRLKSCFFQDELDLYSSFRNAIEYTLISSAAIGFIFGIVGYIDAIFSSQLLFYVLAFNYTSIFSASKISNILSKQHSYYGKILDNKKKISSSLDKIILPYQNKKVYNITISNTAGVS